jgi:hypothetical protein
MSICEKLVLMEIRKDHEDHRQQFGFKPNSSCAHATFVLKEICRYNESKNKTTYVIAIDAIKAFDSVNVISYGTLCLK